MPVKRSKRRKKVKFKKITFKVSANQFSTLQRYCAKHDLTSNKLIKKALKVYLERFGPVIEKHPVKISEKQLTIFDVGADESDAAAMA
ncbi:MAG: hypothetical protein IH597_14355 [Bacteroidales bacterium]|nr:hypothetical protein [Bacteroidales bacterium]